MILAGELSLRGSSIYTVTLARELKLRGHKVCVLGPGGLLDNILEAAGVPVRNAPIHGSHWRNLLYLSTYGEAIREFDPDVLHVQHQDLAALGALLSERTGVPAVMTVHSLVQQRLQFRFGRPPRMIAVSEPVRQSMVTAGQVPRESIEVIPNGVSANLSALEPKARKRSGEARPRRAPVVGTLNRLAEDRGIDVLLRAARRVLDSGVEAMFLVIGEGPAERSIRKLARELDLGEKLTIAVPRARLKDLYRPMDVFVSASQNEGHGIFLLSAMAQALPVVATGVGGVLSFLRDQENGLVVPRGDVSAVADSIVALLKDPEHARELAHAGFRDVREKFPLSAMVEKTVSSYEAAHA